MKQPSNQPQFDDQTLKNVNSWLKGDFDSETKTEIEKQLEENPQEIINAFYTSLTFGTGGLRGVMGIGTNRINIYTIRAATQGFANYLNDQHNTANEHSVFISYDCRKNSRLFAEEAAKVLAGNGIRVYLTKELRPTPYVSFGCRHYGCSAAIMITASHNPPEYNGYKAYWSDGAQAIPPHDQGIIDEVNRITDNSMVKTVASIEFPLIKEIGEEFDQIYIEACATLQTYPQENKEHGKELHVIYSPLHGTGITLVPQMLEAWGFSHYAVIKKQAKPDGTFPTVKSPNPEEREAMTLGIKQLEEENGDILLATDPDADRVGVAVWHGNEAVLLNGNQIACLCLAHVCEGLTKQDMMPENAAFIKTIVTSELFAAIAESYDKKCFNTLTGFKFIAELIRQWENDPEGYTYIFGGEESYGYLLGTLARDKDAVVSVALISEAALHAKLERKTLIDKLHDLYRKYGIFHEELVSINFPETKEGKEQMAMGMERLFNNSPREFAGINVVAVENYIESTKKWLENGKIESLSFPKSNVLLFWLSDGSKLVIRPSGTEPKIKLYCGVKITDFDTVSAGLDTAKQHANALISSAKQLFA